MTAQAAWPWRQRIDLAHSTTHEFTLIGEAVNSYVARINHFVKRKRTFVDTTSFDLGRGTRTTLSLQPRP